MASMGKHTQDQASALSGWSNSCTHIRPRRSHWLRTTLSDLDEKIKAVLDLIQNDDGDSFAKRAEMYYQRRPELIEMLEELRGSCHRFAEKYDHQLKLEFSSQAATTKSLLGDSTHELEATDNLHSESFVEEIPYHGKKSSSKSSKTNYGINGTCKRGDEKKEINRVNEFNDNVSGEFFQTAVSLEREKLGKELRLEVSKLIEDSLQQQAELIKRNDEKRETIEELSSQINRLMGENRALKSSLSCNHKADTKPNRSQASRLKKLLLKKFTASGGF